MTLTRAETETTFCRTTTIPFLCLSASPTNPMKKTRCCFFFLIYGPYVTLGSADDSMLSCILQISEVSAECEMRCEMETRFKQIQARLKTMTEETEEVKIIPQNVAPR